MYYVVKIGRQPGIYNTWTEAEKHVSGYSGAKYKSFKTLVEAETWLSDAKKCCSETITNKLNPNATGVTPSQNKYEHLTLDKDAVLKYDCRKLNIPWSRNFNYTPHHTDNPGFYTPSGCNRNQDYAVHNIIYAITENTTKILPATWTEYDGCLYIFTDGSYKKSSNKAGTGIFFGETGVSLKLPDGFTNNQAELIAILYALHQIKLNAEQLSTCDKHVIVISDSMYCINTVTKWMKAWEKNNWKKGNGESILNPELIQTINTLWSEINKKKSGSNLNGKVKFEHQNSHTTAPVAKQSREYMLWHGNHMADMLATN